MDISTLFDLASNRADAWNTLWQLYIAVSTGVLAIVTASAKPLSKPSTAIIGVGFILFLIANSDAFKNYITVRTQIHEMITASVENKSLIAKADFKDKADIVRLSENLSVPSNEFLGVKLFFIFYWAIGILVLLGVWFIPIIRRRE